MRIRSVSPGVLGALALLPLLLVAGCGPNYPKCKNDKGCKVQEYCVNGLCQQCRDDKDCPGGEACNKGRCEAKRVQRCASDAECPADQSCIDGACRPCGGDAECGEGGKCNAGRCQRPSAISEQPTDEGKGTGGCPLEAVYFDFNEAGLSSEATQAVERDADCLKKSGDRAATLVGRSDPRGTEEYNLALSERRAQAVRDRLSRLGVDSGRLRVVPKGELDAVGTDESGWMKDRRVDVQW